MIANCLLQKVSTESHGAGKEYLTMWWLELGHRQVRKFEETGQKNPRMLPMEHCGKSNEVSDGTKAREGLAHCRDCLSSCD